MIPVYSISSEESDTDDDDLSSVAGAGDQGTCEDSDELRYCMPFNDRSSSPDVDMEPTDNAVDWRSAVSRKGRKKSNTGVETQIKKHKLAEEKLARKRAEEINKLYYPVQCLKYMNVEGHPSLWSRWYMEGLPREVAATGAHVVQNPLLCNPGLLVWTRTIPRTISKALSSEGGQIKLSSLREPCEHAVYIAEAQELCELVTSHELSPHVSQMRQLCDCKLTLVVFNVKDYFKKTGRDSQKSVHSAPHRQTANSNRTPMTEMDFQLAITDLLVSADCDTLIANSASELAQSIVHLTKAIAETPFKKVRQECDDEARFYMRGVNKRCVRVAANGLGVSRLWQQMIAILPQSSLETSRAICAQYKSPLMLYESLESAPAAESIAALADIGVSRAAAPASRARRVGPELARKLHTLFTATNGDQLIE